MSYNGKVYVALDAINDLKAYKELKDFKQTDGSSFNFYDGVEFSREIDKTPDEILKPKIQNNIDKADVVVILLSKTVKSMRRFVKWQVEHAIKSGKPIIVINPNRLRSIDYDYCPTILKTSLSLHIPREEKILELALLNWPKSHKTYREDEKNYKKIFKYAESVYKELYNEEEKEG